ncbi:MAG: TetR/AcrR family transcriptional regulator [Fimbriimonadaceae bacterium]
MLEGAVEQKRPRGISRSKLLDVGLVEFARHGFRGARIDDIAKKAEVNIRMVYHFFHNKEGLYEAVLAREIERANEAAPVLDGLTAEPALWECLTCFGRYCSQHPQYVSLLLYEALDDFKIFNRVAGQDSPLVPGMLGALERARVAGIVRRDVDFGVVITACISTILLYFRINPSIAPEEVEDAVTQIAKIQIEGFLAH